MYVRLFFRLSHFFLFFFSFSYLETTDVNFQFFGQLQGNMTLTKNQATADKKVSARTGRPINRLVNLCSVIDTGTRDDKGECAVDTSYDGGWEDGVSEFVGNGCEGS